jgi:glycerol-3-phosphate dehydrogenase (NAD(P)+)
MRIAVLGAGAWGTALGAAAAARHEVLLWARDDAQAALIDRTRRNERYLGDIELPAALRVSAVLAEAFAHARGGLLVIATPMAALREMLASLPAGMPALWLCKGFEQGSGALGHEIARALRPGVSGGVLSGPSFALEVARGQPTALVAASDDAALAAAAVHAFHGDALRIYTSADVVGVEVGGAVKNVLAIATGIADGMAAAAAPGRPAPGLNARAALITRGLAEMTRLGLALGAQAETFMGLSGLGDLVLTATGDLSRNRRVGLLLAAGRELPQVLAELGHVAEGVYTAPMVLARAQALGVEMPITEAVVEVLAGRADPARALWRLMTRQSRAEAASAPDQTPPA